MSAGVLERAPGLAAVAAAGPSGNAVAARLLEHAAQAAENRRRRWVERYRLQDVVHAISGRVRLQVCGRARIAPAVTMVTGAAGTGYAGLSTCSSIWACPVCSASIRAHRAEELQAACLRHIRDGGGGLFVTLTVPHGRGDALRDLLGLVTRGWHKITQSKGARAYLARLGYLGNVRALEVTHGVNGWHPHVHLLLFTRGLVVETERAAFRAWLHARWVRYCTARGWKAPSAAHGCDVQTVVSMSDVGAYVGKVQDEHGTDRVLGHEMTRADLKSARRRASRTPFGLLGDIAALSDGAHTDSAARRRLGALWGEYETATKGLAAIRWSKGLRDALAVEEVTDQEIIAAETNAAAEPVLTIDARTWSLVSRAGQRGRLRAEVDRHGPAAGVALLEQLVAADNAAFVAVMEQTWGADVPEWPPDF